MAGDKGSAVQDKAVPTLGMIGGGPSIVFPLRGSHTHDLYTV